MHHPSGTQIVFTVENDCFTAGGDPVSVTVAGLDGLYAEPYEDLSMMYQGEPDGTETLGAYALPIGDRTLCVYLTWVATTNEEQLASARQIVDSIRGQPYGEDGIRINFTVPDHWDIG